MNITMNIYYTGKGANAHKFAEEMLESGIVDAIRSQEGNLRYEYFMPMEDPETVLLIDSWVDEEALEQHHASAYMKKIASLREKYDVHMRVERYQGAEIPAGNNSFIRK